MLSLATPVEQRHLLRTLEDRGREKLLRARLRLLHEAQRCNRCAQETTAPDRPTQPPRSRSRSF